MIIRTPAYAIGWSLIKKHQRGVIVLTLLPFFLVITRLLLEQLFPLDLVQKVSRYQVILLTTSIPYLLIIFTFSESSPKQFQQGFPKYTFTHPLSNFRLAIYPVFFGILYTYFLSFIWLLLVFHQTIESVQYFTLFFYIASFISWFQMISWRLNHAPYLSGLVMLVLIDILFVLVVSTWDNQLLTPILPQPEANLLLVLFCLSGIGLTINSVMRARSNQNNVKSNYLSKIRLIGFNLPKNYHSVSHALFNYEWRIFGWILPMAGLFMLIILIAIAIYTGINQEIIDPIAFMGFGLIYLPWFLPTEMSHSDFSSKNSKSSNATYFLSKLPISNFQLALAKLKLLAASIGLFHLMVLLGINAIVFSIESSPLLINPWIALTKQFGVAHSLLIVIGSNLLIVTITWVLGANTLAWCLKGDRFFIARRAIILAFGFLLIIPLSFRFVTSAGFREELWSYAPLLNIVLLVSIGFIFIRSYLQFQLIGSLALIKPALLVTAAVFSFFTTSLISLDLINGNNPHLLILLFDLFLLSLLPFFTSVRSVTQSRST